MKCPHPANHDEVRHHRFRAELRVLPSRRDDDEAAAAGADRELGEPVRDTRELGAARAVDLVAGPLCGGFFVQPNTGEERRGVARPKQVRLT